MAKKDHPYFQKKVAIATKHGKERSLGPSLFKHLQIQLIRAEDVDTDTLGTFTGEKKRKGSPLETAIQKARLGIFSTNLPFGIANEGSFGPHPQLPFFNADQEIVVFVDTERDIVIEEQMVSSATNVAEIKVSDLTQADQFLEQSQFGSHAVIVRPNSSPHPDPVAKGITDRKTLEQLFKTCLDQSSDGLVHLETDMRAHLNPSRQKVISELGEKLAVRLLALCENCDTPGWGNLDYLLGLPCESCQGPTELVAKEIQGCVKCTFRKVVGRSDKKTTAPTHLCPHCNP
jgi:hypothetical protein